jgi:hypothetical protein
MYAATREICSIISKTKQALPAGVSFVVAAAVTAIALLQHA